MDPRIRQLLMARQQQMGAEQPQPEQGVPEGGDFSLGEEFDQNPFEAIVNGGQAQAPQGMGVPQEGEEQGGYAQIPPGMEEAAQMGGVMPEEDDQLQKGAGAGSSKFLLGAAQQLQGYIAESTERDEIAIARSILQLLTKLIDRDQQKLTEKLDQAPQQPQPSMGGMMGAMQGGAQGGIPGAATGQ